METNKVIAGDLNETKSTSLWIGFVISLALLYFAFELTHWEVEEKVEIPDFDPVYVADEMVPITQQEEQQPAAPVMVTPEVPEILNIVDDNVEIPDQEITTSEETNQAITAAVGNGEAPVVVEGPAGPGPVVVAPPAVVAPPPPPPPAPAPKKEVVQEDETIYEAPQQMASFPGGEEALYKWLYKNLKYPPRCQDQGVQGRVMLKFIVEKDGSIAGVQVQRSPDQELANEAVRVVKSMPRWNPAKQGNKTVRSYFNLPVTFKIQ